MTELVKKYRKIILNSLVNELSKSDFPLPDAVASKCSEFSEAIYSANEEIISYLNRNALERARNRKRLMGSRVKVVSLGFNCLPRTVLTRWGVKPSRLEGELTYPFDLAVHPTDVVGNLLCSDFDKYLESSALEVVNGVPVNRGVGVTFNHETGIRFIENNFQLLLEKYRSRVDNFRGLSAQDSVLFVHHLKKGGSVEGLVEALHGFRGDLAKKDALLIINSDAAPFAPEMLTSNFEMRVELLHSPVPYQGYVWHMEEHYSSSSGMEFELAISNKASSMIDFMSREHSV